MDIVGIVVVVVVVEAGCLGRAMPLAPMLAPGQALGMLTCSCLPSLLGMPPLMCLHHHSSHPLALGQLRL